MLPQLSQCCCGCSLQTGTILIGGYEMVRGIYEIFTNFVIGLSIYLHIKGWHVVWDGFPFAETILGALKSIAAIVLIFGANKERYRLVFWWMIVIVALLIIDAVLFPLATATFFMYASTTEAVFALILGLGDIVLELYFLWVVFSYYRIIEERAPTTVAPA